MNDLETRDYDVKNIGKEDVRFTDCAREAKITQIISLLTTVIGITLAYIISPSLEEVANAQKYLFGYPLWVMLPTLIFASASVFFIIYGAKYVKRPSLDPRVPQNSEGALK